MSFINALKEIGKNSKNFKEWDKKEQDKKAQRNKMQTTSPISENELKKAQSKGEVIMNAIDIMDTHSEEVAENVETAIMPIAQIAPAVSLGLSGFLTNKTIVTPSSKAINKAYGDFVRSDDGTKLKELISKIKDYQISNPNKLTKFKVYSDSTRAFSKKNLKELSMSDDANIKSIYKEIVELAKKYNDIPAVKNYGKKLGLASGLIFGITAISYIASNILAAKLQVKSSRIARWQSRQDLNDAKYFVQYTDEQINEAKNNLTGTKEEKNRLSAFNRKNSFLATLRETMKDNKKYEEWKANYNQEDKKIKRDLTNEETIDAEKEKELIQRITKEINNNAEEYGENMETAAGVLIGGTPFLGAGIGAIINTIINKTGLDEKISKKSFDKILKEIPDEADKKKITELYEAIKKSSKNKDATLTEKVEILKNFGDISERLAHIKDKEKVKGIAGLISNLKKGINLALTTKPARNTMIGVLGGMITGIAGAFIGLKLQKSASRVGRFKAKREIQENPQNFIGYTNEQYAKVQDTKAEKQSAGKKFLNYITFIPRCIKEYFEYKKYTKTKAKEQKELLSELVKNAKVTDNQLKEAKDLQRKLFVTFENVDDKSQEYSESTEAVTEMIAPFVPYLGILFASIPLMIGGVKLYKGGKAYATESITGFLAKHTKFLKGKHAQKYTDEVAQNISHAIEKQEVLSQYENNEVIKIFKTLFEGSGNVKELIPQIMECIRASKGKENELQAFIYEIAKLDYIKQIDTTKTKELINSLASESLLNNLKKRGIEIPNDNIELIKKEMLDFTQECSNLGDVLRKIADKNIFENIKLPDTSILEKNIGINSEEIVNFINKLKNSTEGMNLKGMASAYIEGQIKVGNWRNIVGILADNTTGNISRMLYSLQNSSIKDEQALKIFKNITTILDNIPASDLSKIINVAVEEFGKNPEKFMSALKNGSFQKVLLTKNLINAGAITGATWTSLCLVLTFCVESFFASTQKKAGKLGVMKALEELEDVKYYANDNNNNVNDNAPTKKESDIYKNFH